MVLRCVVAQDDSYDKAGNLLTDALFWDGDDGEVDAIEGVNPTLRELIVWENGTLATATAWRTRCTLQMNTWPNTKRINHFGDRMGGLTTDSGTHTTAGTSHHSKLDLDGRYNIPVQAGDDWISDNSYIYASLDNSTVAGIVFCYSYGAQYPYRGGHMQWIRKVADAAETGADIFYQAWAGDLTGVAPGLDPKKNYVLRGIGHEAAATAKAGTGAFVQPQASAYKLFGPSWTDFGLCVTQFNFDGIPVTGGDGFVAKTCSNGAADTPYVWLGFEEYGAGPVARTAGKGRETKPRGSTVGKIMAMLQRE